MGTRKRASFNWQQWALLGVALVGLELLFFPVIKCGEPARDVREEPTALATASARVAVKAPDSPADSSLSIEQYVAKGVPALDQAWTAQDYQRACNALLTLAKEDATRLPRMRSERSGALFQRLVSKEVLRPYEDPGLDLPTRLTGFTTLGGSVPGLLMTYQGLLGKGHHIERESLELMVMQARVIASMEPAMVAFQAEAHRRRVPDKVLRPQFDQLATGARGVAQGALMIIAARDVYSRSDRSWYIDELRLLLPSLLSLMNPDQRSDTRKQVDALWAAETDPEVKKALDTMRETIFVAKP